MSVYLRSTCYNIFRKEHQRAWHVPSSPAKRFTLTWKTLFGETQWVVAIATRGRLKAKTRRIMAICSRAKKRTEINFMACRDAITTMDTTHRLSLLGVWARIVASCPSRALSCPSSSRFLSAELNRKRQQTMESKHPMWNFGNGKVRSIGHIPTARDRGPAWSCILFRQARVRLTYSLILKILTTSFEFELWFCLCPKQPIHFVNY